jgi:hypothetical protein
MSLLERRVLSLLFIASFASTVAAADFVVIPAPPTCVISKQKTLGEWKEQFKITEVPDAVVAQGPTMEMSAQLDCKLEKSEEWDVGFIQLILDSRLILSAGDYDFVADFKQYPLLDTASPLGRPWIGVSKRQLSDGATVYFKDGPMSATGWYMGEPNPAGPNEPRLQTPLHRIKRDSLYDAYLVVMNRATKEYFALQRVRWKQTLDIALDANKPIGSRATVKVAEISVVDVQNSNVLPPPPDVLSGPLATSAMRMNFVKSR